MASFMRPVLMRQTALAAARPALRSSMMLNNAVRVSAFHASSRKNLLPPGPQVIKGTVNDPAPIPPTSPSHGSYHWTFDRIVAAGLIPMVLTPFAAGSINPTLDAALCGLMLIHTHQGFQNIVVDYIPTTRYPGLRKFFVWALNAATLVVGVGLYEFETNDVGITEAVKRIWKA